jgi:hypothetical protein
MEDPRAQRTLVKSPPELWSEISDLEALAGHLGAFGEIRITRLEPETTVAWEGDRARGTVELEPAGWGTKVTLTACVEAGAAGADPGPRRDPEAQAEVAVGRPRWRRWWRRFGRRRGEAPATASPPGPLRPPAPAAEPETIDADHAQAVLTGVLDALGAARHRPFSRA